MKTGVFFLIVLSFLSIISCEYTPTETHYKEIAVPDPDINLQILNENELNFLRGRVTVNFSSVLNGKEIKLIKVLLNTTVIENYHNTSGSIEIDTDDYPDGAYELTFQLYTSTGTGSLADLAGAEAFVLTKKYNVQIYNAPVITPQITEMFLTGTDLNVKWNTYNGQGFQKYVLLYNNVVLKEIFDQDSVEIIDPAYVGGTTTRTIKTYVANRPFESSYKIFSSPQINFISATIQNQNSVVLTWERNNFDNAFGEYRISRAVSEGSFLAQISDINTTTFTDDNPVFGGEITYGIEAVPYHLVNTYPLPANITVPSIGQPFSFYDGTYINYIPVSDVYYTFKDDKISVYDNSFNLIKSGELDLMNGTNAAEYGITTSSNGELIYVIKDYMTGEVAKINSTTLQVEQTYNLWTIAGGQTGSIWRIGISDNNIMAAFCSSSISPRVYLYDMTNGTLITSVGISEQSYSDRVVISPNGKYLKSEDNLFRLDGSTITFIGNVARYALFLQDSESLVQMTNNKLQLIKCSDLSILKEVSFQNNLYEVRLCVDKAEGFIGVESFSTNNFYIVDIHNQVIKKKMPVAHYWVKFQNRTLFSNYLRLRISF